MKWKRQFIEQAQKDFRKLDHSQQVIVKKALDKISINPLPEKEGGYGKPLGNKNNFNLTGCLKVKLKKHGIRIVYKLERQEETYTIIIIGIRDDMEVYELATKRLNELNE